MRERRLREEGRCRDARAVPRLLVRKREALSAFPSRQAIFFRRRVSLLLSPGAPGAGPASCPSPASLCPLKRRRCFCNLCCGLKDDTGYFLLLCIISLLTYIPTWGVRSGNHRRAEVFGAGPSSDTGFTARPRLSHLSAWVSSGAVWGFCSIFWQENGFVSQGIGRKHAAMWEVGEKRSLWIFSRLGFSSRTREGRGETLGR